MSFFFRKKENKRRKREREKKQGTDSSLDSMIVCRVDKTSNLHFILIA